MQTSIVAPVSVIVFHKNAWRHIDDAACLWVALTRPEAEARYPGISKAEIIFDGTGGESYEGKSGDELEKEGILMFGVGGGRLDAHPGPNNPGKPECEFSLFCKELGILDDPALARIIAYVAESDRGNSGHAMSIGAMAKIMHNAYPDDPMKVFRWQIDALTALYIEQARFLKTEEEFEEKAAKELVEGPSGKDLLVVTIESENQLIKDVAFFKGAEIIIQRRPTSARVMPGNMSVFTSRRARISLKEVIAAIRQEEQRANDSPVTADRKKLCALGKIEGERHWFYLVGDSGEMLLNGSDSAPDTPATKLPLKVVRDIVVSNLQRRG